MGRRNRRRNRGSNGANSNQIGSGGGGAANNNFMVRPNPIFMPMKLRCPKYPPSMVERPKVTRWVRMQFTGSSGTVAILDINNADANAYGVGSRYSTVSVLQTRIWASTAGAIVPSSVLVSIYEPNTGQFLYSAEDQAYGLTDVPCLALQWPKASWAINTPASSGTNVISWSSTATSVVIDVLATFG
jgi:hypothetical protein